MNMLLSVLKSLKKKKKVGYIRGTEYTPYAFLYQLGKRTRITYLGINFTQLRSTDLYDMPWQGFSVFVVRDLLPSTNSSVDRIILSTWNLESRTDNASEYKT